MASLFFPAIFVFIFGLVIGSFLNCLIWRLHSGQSMWGRSACPKCKKMISWYDNVPVLSYLILKGRCRHCHCKISAQYPIVELVTGFLFVLAFANQQSAFDPQLSPDFLILNLFKYWFIISVMIIIFIYDLRWYLILDIVTLPACAAVFLLNLALGFNWQDVLISGIIGGSFFLIQYVVSKGKWIGGGDIRLGLLIGLSLGMSYSILAIFLSYMIGSAISIYLVIAGKKQWSSKIPLGIFLAVGTIISLFWGKEIINWYFGLF